MRDSNMPKFLSEDAMLFQAIVSDLFPPLTVPDPGRYPILAKLQTCVKQQLQAAVVSCQCLIPVSCSSW